jgi:2,3-bisphosphoglycerate-dependent phosphoglycerate mutase
MGVGFQVGSIIDEIGTPDFLHAFFSTISYRLEPKGWGSRYPNLMLHLYEEGKLDSSLGEEALREAADARERLREFPPNQVVWDVENLTARPPWGDDISTDVTDLSNYFVTSTGRDLFEVLVECLEALLEEGGEMEIVQV